MNTSTQAASRHAIPGHALALLAAVAVFWGTNWPMMKFVLLEWNVWHFRTVCLVLGCAALFGLGRAMKYPMRVPEGQWGRLIAASIFNITLWHIFSGFGVSLLASGRASIIGYTMPLWVVPLSMWLLNEPMTRRKWLGLVLGFIGLVLLLGDEVFRMQKAPLGALCMLTAAVSWAIGIVLVKRYPVTLPTTVFSGWMMLIGGIPVFILTAVFASSEIRPLSGRAVLALAYVVVVAMVFCHWAFRRLGPLLPATITGIASLTVPVVGVFSGMLMLGERPGLADWAAMALILAALGVVLMPARREPPGPSAAAGASSPILD